MTETTDLLGLGIDAGGTFTDGAVVDLRRGIVLSKHKTSTVKDDLSGSIRRCLDGLDARLLSECTLVSLSTTFATNAIVEGKGARAGMLLLGYDDYDTAGVSAEHKISVRGRHDIRGREIEPLDIPALREAIARLAGDERVESLAVSGMCGVLNPAHEITAREIIRSESSLPVVCGHELSMELDAIRRATTAYYNARLLPVVVDLIRSVEAELVHRGISAPLMVVRSDGSLMSSAEALTHPIHTIFSGPAASAIGALYLSGEKDAVIVDIGGTTTDILIATDGEVLMTSRGSTVNGLAVSIPSVLSHTVGFGGDSRICRDTLGYVTVGPERVMPICVLADHADFVVDELSSMSGQSLSTLYQPVDFYTTGWACLNGDTSPGEGKVLSALSDGPKSAASLAEICGCPHPSLLPVERLVSADSIMRAGLTPTDVLHAVGRFSEWNVDAATVAVDLYASGLGQSREEFCARVLRSAETRLAEELLRAGLNVVKGNHNSPGVSPAVVGGGTEIVRLRADFARPVIGIGAPISAYLPNACRVFDMQPLIPEHSEVANAVGAVAGRIVVKAKAVVEPLGAGIFSVHTPLDQQDFFDLDEAEAYAACRAREFLDARIRDDYEGFSFRYEVRPDRRYASSTEGDVLVESAVIVAAVCTSIPRRVCESG